MSPALTHWGMTQAEAMTVTVMGQVSGKRDGWGVGRIENGRRWQGEWWECGLLRMIRETRQKTIRDECVSMDGYIIVWIFEVDLTSEKLCVAFLNISISLSN